MENDYRIVLPETVVLCASIFFIAYGSTWLAYGIWNNMLRLYSVAMVIPFALLVPFFGMISGNLIFNEPMQSWKLHAAWLIIGGLCINILGSRWIARHQTLANAKLAKLSSTDIPAVNL